MRVLSLDTTTRAGSVALVEDDRVRDERRGDPSRGHAERLPGEILAIVDAHALALSDIDLYAVASGPGSFTGLRIGIATMQGLAFVNARRLVAISALEALAHAALAAGTSAAFVAPWMDAQRREVFTALYQVVRPAAFEPGALIELESPAVGDPAETIARWAGRIDVSVAAFVGDGAVKHAGVIRAGAGPAAPVLESPLLAGAIGRLALARGAEDADPATVRPLYVRRPDAEIARDAANR